MHDECAPDRRVAELAARQHGAISSAQLREAGLTRNAVMTRCRAGHLHPLHRGVYAVGHVSPSKERRWVAAVLALGKTATDGLRGPALSHRSAASLWDLLPPRDGPVDVSLPDRNGRRGRKGIRIHRPRSLEPQEITRRHGIPVTTPVRTIEDLRSIVSGRELRSARRRAEYLGLPLGPDSATDRTRSELERRFLWLCGRHHLPRPAVNMSIGLMTVDFCWVEQRLIVETDGYRSHGGHAAFEADRARALRLHDLGYDVRHFSYRQVFDESKRVIESLRPQLIVSTGAPLSE